MLIVLMAFLRYNCFTFSAAKNALFWFEVGSPRVDQSRRSVHATSGCAFNWVGASTNQERLDM